MFVEWCVYFYDLMKLQNSEIQVKFFSLPERLSNKCREKKYAPSLKPNRGVLTLYDSFLPKAWHYSSFFFLSLA